MARAASRSAGFRSEPPTSSPAARVSDFTAKRSSQAKTRSRSSSRASKRATARELTKLPDPIPIEESAPWPAGSWSVGGTPPSKKETKAASSSSVQFLLPADPLGALQKMSAVKFSSEKARGRLQSLVRPRRGPYRFRGRRDPGRVDRRPGHPRRNARAPCRLAPRRRETTKARDPRARPDPGQGTSTPIEPAYQSGEVAGRLHELGETEKARSPLRRGPRARKAVQGCVVRTKPAFTAMLARVDSAGAIEMAKQVAGEELYGPLASRASPSDCRGTSPPRPIGS